MTWEEVRSLQISNVIASTTEYNNLVKQCLSIAQTSTLKDNEISMWIASAIEDMVRQGIDVASNTSNGLIQGAIVMYVKANFGNVDIQEKKLAQERYLQAITNLSLSSKYLLREEIE